MRFEVVYANGVQHDVELEGTLATVGRDPSCELVLNDAKCSRKHAIFEAGPDGIDIRDNGSANGIFVNGRRVERAHLKEGDIIRLGETVLKVLPENITGTVAMDVDDLADFEETEPVARPHDLGPSEPPSLAAPAPTPPPVTPPPQPVDRSPLEDLPPPPAPPPLPARTPPPRTPPPRAATPALPSSPFSASPPAGSASPAKRPSASQPSAPPRRIASYPREAAPRPLTVTTLAILWLLAGAAYGSLGLAYALFGGLRGAAAGLAGVGGVLLALLSGVMGFGLWSRAPWARLLQLALAGIGVLVCPVTLPSLAILAYLLRPEAKNQFSAERGGAAGAEQGSTEVVFSIAIVAGFLVGLLFTAAAVYFALPYLHKPQP